VLNDGYPLAFLRGDDVLVVINPRRESAEIRLDGLDDSEPLVVRGASCERDLVLVEGFGFGIWRLAAR